MGSLQLLFPGGTGWNLSLHAPTVTAPISSTWRARAVRFFSPYFPALCRSLHLPLYCEVVARIASAAIKRVGLGQGKGKGGTFNASVAGGRASHAGTGLGPTPSHMPCICARHATAPYIPPLQGTGAATVLRMPLAAPLEGSMALGQDDTYSLKFLQGWDCFSIP
jgi:hypothetical protein